MSGPQRTGVRLAWSWAMGRLKLSDFTGKIATVQAQFTGDRLLDKAKLLQHFGFASRPPADTDLVAICPSGEPTSALVIASNHQAHRPPALKDGDAVLYDQRGAYVWMSAEGLQVEAKNLAVAVKGATTVTVEASSKITLRAPKIDLNPVAGP